MQTIDLLYVNYNLEAPCRGYWDMTFLDDILCHKQWKPIYEYNFKIKELRQLSEYSKGAIIVLAARSQVDFAEKFNKDIQKYGWVLLFIVGDEEQLYPIEKIKHKNIKIYTMSDVKENTTGLMNGYAPQIHYSTSSKIEEKKYAWFFSGQVTHQRRIDCVNELKKRDDGVLNTTSGFAKGLPHETYYDYLYDSVVSLCPSGPATPDTFRLYEALEMACVPIADSKTIKNNTDRTYWTQLFGEEPPFPILEEYSQLNGYIDDCINEYPKRNNDTFSWWIRYKRDFTYKIIDDISTLSKTKPTKTNNITVIMPVSPIKSHPDISILDETIRSIRHHLPTSEIILTFDGVREEQKDRMYDYNEFIRRILWKCNTEYKNVYPLIFKEHMHQTAMAREALKYVKTDLILYVEQDTPLVFDYEIPFKTLSGHILSGTSNMIRFHFEAMIPKEHEHMMHGTEPGIELTKTSQWSQRPHLASKAFYDRILKDYFTDNAKSFIEDKMHGVVDNAYRQFGIQGWNQFRVHIYTPDGNIKRNYHLDGRENEEKYDNLQIF